jgi:hypothetical protein
MPSLEQDNLMPEKVVEIDAQNKTLQRWSKPIDAIVLAIAGDQILVEADSNQRYWIDTAGNIQLETQSSTFPKPESEPYQKHSEFGSSGVFSGRFRDLNSGSDRRILADAPCT